MIEGIHPVLQALLAGLFTWFVTAAGAAVALLPIKCTWLLDGSLGFAAGVMSAASFWSLLAPAIEQADKQLGSWAIVPIAIAFLLGAAFVYASDYLLPFLGFSSNDEVTAYIATGERVDAHSSESQRRNSSVISTDPSSADATHRIEMGQTNGRQIPNAAPNQITSTTDGPGPKPFNSCDAVVVRAKESYRRIMLLIIAVVVHNIPEGFAIGAAFGAIGSAPSATFQSAVALALGIGIQNFPEGMAVSMPLAGFGYKKWKCFLLGQSSGAVEPISAVIGAALVSVIAPAVPYALSFAAGSMLTAVFDDIIPEAQAHNQARTASVGAIIGFTIMMALEVAAHF